MHNKGLVLSIIDLDQALHRPNGGSRRFQLFLDAAAAACESVRLVAFTPVVNQVCDERQLTGQIERLWGIKIHLRNVIVPPVPISNSKLYLNPIFRASDHPEFSRFYCEVVRESVLSEMALDPDVVIVRGQALADSFTEMTGRPSRAHYDMDDISHRKYRRMVKAGEIWGPRWLNALQYPCRKYYDRSVASAFLSSYVCSETDKHYCMEKMGLQNVSVVPNAMPVHPPMPQVKSHSLLFVGSLGYAPNARALHLLIDRILPLLVRRFGDVEVLVAGEAPEAIRKRYEKVKNVKLLGFVEDLDSVYAASRAVVCPIISGGGTRVKLIEAAMRGKPIITTRIGAEGLGFVDQEHMLEANDPQSFAEACARILVDDEIGFRIGSAARALAQSCLSFTSVRDRLAALLLRENINRASPA